MCRGDRLAQIVHAYGMRPYFRQIAHYVKLHSISRKRVYISVYGLANPRYADGGDVDVWDAESFLQVSVTGCVECFLALLPHMAAGAHLPVHLLSSLDQA
jgi:hypothetical protein